MKKFAENTINSMSYSDPKHPLGGICKKIELAKILKVYQQAVNNIHEIYKLEIESDTQKGMIFQITFFLSSDEEQMGADSEKYRLESLVYRGFPVKIRV